MRTVMLLVVAVGALALSVPAALATTATGSADGITVTVSLSDTATAGEPFTVAESIENTTTRAKLVRVTQTLEGPDGVVFSIRYPLIVPAGKTLAFELTFTFPANVPPGAYSVDADGGESERYRGNGGRLAGTRDLADSARPVRAAAGPGGRRDQKASRSRARWLGPSPRAGSRLPCRAPAPAGPVRGPAVPTRSPAPLDGAR